MLHVNVNFKCVTLSYFAVFVKLCLNREFSINLIRENKSGKRDKSR